MTIGTNRFSWATFTAGSIDAGDDFSILSNVGIGGMGRPAGRTTLTDRQGNGQEPGASYSGSRIISASIWTPYLDTVEAFEAAMDARPDPTDHLPWTYRITDKAERRLYVRPESFDYLWDTNGVGAGMWRCDCEWIAADPTKYSEAQTSHIFGTGSATDAMATTPAQTFTFTATNGGLRAVSSGRALELRITAHGTVVNPYIKIYGDADRSGEQVTWFRTMTSGQVLTTDDQLTARVGSTQVCGVALSEGSSPFLYWPRLNPGDQQIRIGCASGTISGYLKTRDTW